jgi:hypothetical protein
MVEHIFTAKQMPIVFWSVDVAEFKMQASAMNGTKAKVQLPGGQIVAVEDIRYQGSTCGRHNFQGQMSVTNG